MKVFLCCIMFYMGDEAKTRSDFDLFMFFLMEWDFKTELMINDIKFFMAFVFFLLCFLL